MSAGRAPLRIGILGFGKIAQKRFLPATSAVALVELTAIGTRRPANAIEHTAALGRSPLVLSYDGLLARGRDVVDAVYIALPNHLHLTWARCAADAGLHVLCEKPFGANLDGALECRRVFADRSLILCEAFMYRHDPRHERVRQLVADGAVGRVVLVEAFFSYLLEDLGNIRMQSATDGGALMDVGCYGIDVARFLLAEEPIDVSASGVHGARSGVDELSVTTMRFPSGAMATSTASTRIARKHLYRVHGTHGMITVPQAFVPGDDVHRTVVVERSDGAKTTEVVPPFAAFEAQLRHFAECVAVGELRAPAEDGVETARVLELAATALRKKRSLLDAKCGEGVVR